MTDGIWNKLDPGVYLSVRRGGCTLEEGALYFYAKNYYPALIALTALIAAPCVHVCVVDPEPE